MVVVPFRFAHVEEGVYRGAYPTLKNLLFLKQLALKSILSLTPEKPSADLEEFCLDHKVSLFHFKVKKFNEEITLQYDTICQVLGLVLNNANHPIYVHCLDGTHVTGWVFMCLRRLQNWPIALVCSEFARFIPERECSREEQQFVERFEGPIEFFSKDVVPKWLWTVEYSSSLRHPQIQLIHPQDSAIPEPSPTESSLLQSPKRAASSTKPKTPQRATRYIHAYFGEEASDALEKLSWVTPQSGKPSSFVSLLSLLRENEVHIL